MTLEEEAKSLFHVTSDNICVMTTEGKLSRDYEKLVKVKIQVVVLTPQTVMNFSSEDRETLLQAYQQDELLHDLRLTHLTPDLLESMLLVETGRAFPVYLTKFNGQLVSKFLC